MKTIISIFIIAFVCLSNYQSFAKEPELPLIVVDEPANELPMIFQISSENGFKSFDQQLSEEYQSLGYPLVALNTFKYFWAKKTPEQLANDLIPVIKKYMTEWNKKEIVLVGYSFGAQIIPFLMTRLPDDLKSKVKLIVLLTPGKFTDFTIHLNDKLLMDEKNAMDVEKEINKITETKILSIFGSNEAPIFLKQRPQKNVKVLMIKGGHSFSDVKIVMKYFLEELKQK